MAGQHRVADREVQRVLDKEQDHRRRQGRLAEREERQRQADDQDQAHELLDPVRQADDRVQVMEELYDQPACNEVDQQDLEDVATP